MYRSCQKTEGNEEAIQKYDLYHADALTILRTVGGLDAGLVGLCIGGAMCHLQLFWMESLYGSISGRTNG